jgi:hypothetical protein
MDTQQPVSHGPPGHPIRTRKRTRSRPTGRVTPDVASVRVWSYWTGPQPPWIGLCLETLRRNCPTAEVLDDTVWSTIYDGSIPPAVILRQRPNVRSDVLRSWLLTRYGGIWIDADAIVWRDLRPIAGWLRSKEFVAYRVRRRELCSALIAARAGSRIAAEYWRSIQQALTPGAVVRPYALGPALLRTIRRIGPQHCRFLRPELVHPVHWDFRRRFTRPGRYTPRNGAWCFMLTHRSLGRLRNASREQLLVSDTLIGSLFRRALISQVAPPQQFPEPPPKWHCLHRGQAVGKLDCGCSQRQEVYTCGRLTVGYCIIVRLRVDDGNRIRLKDGRLLSDVRYTPWRDASSIDAEPQPANQGSLLWIPVCRLCPHRKAS